MSCTPFGKLMRMLRIKHNESMRDIANLLGVTTVYVSVVELGKRAIPAKWLDVLVEHYGTDQKDALINAAAASTNKAVFKLTGVEPYKRELIFRFERTFNNLDESTAQKITELLKNKI